MNNKRYFVHKHLFRGDEVQDINCGGYLKSDQIERLLNKLEEDRQFLKELKIEYKRISNVLEDFMDITNRLQANPNDTQAQYMSRDMLILMGKDVLKDGEEND